MENAPTQPGDSQVIEEVTEVIQESFNNLEAEESSRNHRMLMGLAPKKLMGEFEKSWGRTPGLTLAIKKYPKASGSTDALINYMSEISRMPLLTKEGETLLSQYIYAGVDADYGTDDFWRKVWAKEKLILSNLRLVVNIAKKYFNPDSTVELTDLIQDGNIGLDTAADKFDWRKGFKFSTYATWWVMQSITRGSLNASKAIRIPAHQDDRVRRMVRVENEAQNEGRTLTDEQIARAIGVKVVDLARLKEARQLSSVLSLDQSTTGNSSTIIEAESTLGYMIGEEDEQFEAVERQIMIEKMLQILPTLEVDERSKEVILRRKGFYDGREHTLGEIAEDLNISNERVRQIEKEVIEKLRVLMGYGHLNTKKIKN